MLENINPQFLLYAGLALAAVVMLRKLRSFSAERQRGSSPGESSSRLRGLARAESDPAEPPNDFLRWQVEMHQTARELKAEIDSKLVALQAATRLAREEQRRLEQSIERARQTTRPDPLGTLPQAGDRSAARSEFSDANLPVARQPATLPTNASQAATIAALARAGHSATRIASELALPLGDVELSLSLGGAK